ncbi:hypothetical protein [Hyphomonas pacifica]|uniref:hypothetical protein n=1 Tax=Hyphomonas pacifica TaxID=1280941 RepID=UPI000DBFC3AE|nr:hypothetical protein [Hyphomonas pacifica]RAN33837.1 hypothetical protein HY11_03850 [Hyphomonas pacifica]
MVLLTRTPVLWGSFILFLLIGVGFGIFSGVVGGAYLDTLDGGEASRALIASMTPAQRSAHFWLTVLLDTAYPLAYGALFAGLALRCLGRYGRLAALPALAVVVVDLTENMVQALALSGAVDALDAKVWLTPLKFGLFFLAAGIALVALLIATVNRVCRGKAG